MVVLSHRRHRSAQDDVRVMAGAEQHAAHEGGHVKCIAPLQTAGTDHQSSDMLHDAKGCLERSVGLPMLVCQSHGQDEAITCHLRVDCGEARCAGGWRGSLSCSYMT